MVSKTRQRISTTSPRVNGSGGDGFCASEPVTPVILPSCLWIIEAAAERVKNKPWAAVYEEVLVILGVTFRALNVIPLTTAARRATTETQFRFFLTSLLELIGADPRYVTDPFQGLIYTHATREDYRTAGEAYVAAAGGEDVLHAELEEEVVWSGFQKMRDDGDARALAIWQSYSDIVRGLSPADAMTLRKAMLADDDFKTGGATTEQYRQHPYRMAKQLGLGKQQGQKIKE